MRPIVPLPSCIQGQEEGRCKGSTRVRQTDHLLPTLLWRVRQDAVSPLKSALVVPGTGNNASVFPTDLASGMGKYRSVVFWEAAC